MNTMTVATDVSVIPTQPRADWRDQAVVTFQQHQPRAMMAMKTDLVGRLDMLIGRRIPEDSIYVDSNQQIAVVLIDKVLFRWCRQAVVVVRPCVECGLGQFESPALLQSADVGYALSAWQPLHPHCQPEDPVNWLEREDGTDR